MLLTLHLKPTLLGGLDSLEYGPCGGPALESRQP